MPWFPKKCVVVPFDFSNPSAKALDFARDLVEDVAALHVIHVLDPVIIPEPGLSWTAADDDIRRREMEAAFRHRFGNGPIQKVDFRVRVGDPGTEIASYAEQLKAELIVLPSHGRTGLSRLLIGSVAERVVRLAHCPVLVLK